MYIHIKCSWHTINYSNAAWVPICLRRYTYGHCNSGIQSDVIEQKKGERNPKGIRHNMDSVTIDPPHPPSSGGYLNTRTKRDHWMCIADGHALRQDVSHPDCLNTLCDSTADRGDASWAGNFIVCYKRAFFKLIAQQQKLLNSSAQNANMVQVWQVIHWTENNGRQQLMPAILS